MSPSASRLERICVFCGSTAGDDPRYLSAVADLGRALAEQYIGLVYGGSRMGMMGRLADTVLEAGGTAVGVMPRPLMNREIVHPGLTRLVVTDSMHERKAEMVALSDGFIAAPGGLGTLEEFLEVLTWAQLGFHRKPCGLLDSAGYYGPLTRLLDHASREGFVQETHRRMVLVEERPDALLDRMEAYEPPAIPRWIGEDQI